MLAQLAYHGAKLYAQREGMAQAEAFSVIIKSFEEELKNNTGEATGEIPD
jgi:hypothetical protein